MPTESRQVLQWVAGGLLLALGCTAIFIYAYDSVQGHPVDAATTNLIALVVGVISSVFSYNIGANATANATAQANLNTAAVVAAANGTAGPVAKAHVGLSSDPAPDAQQPGITLPASQDNPLAGPA